MIEASNTKSVLDCAYFCICTHGKPSMLDLSESYSDEAGSMSGTSQSDSMCYCALCIAYVLFAIVYCMCEGETIEEQIVIVVGCKVLRFRQHSTHGLNICIWKYSEALLVC